MDDICDLYSRENRSVAIYRCAVEHTRARYTSLAYSIWCGIKSLSEFALTLAYFGLWVRDIVTKMKINTNKERFFCSKSLSAPIALSSMERMQLWVSCTLVPATRMIVSSTFSIWIIIKEFGRLLGNGCETIFPASVYVWASMCVRVCVCAWVCGCGTVKLWRWPETVPMPLLRASKSLNVGRGKQNGKK